MRLVLALIAVMLLALPVMAETTQVSDYQNLSTSYYKNLYAHDHGYYVADAKSPMVEGIVDAPNLIRFTKNLTLGAQVSHDITSLFYDDLDYEINDGWFIGAKITYTGTLLDLTKK